MLEKAAGGKLPLDYLLEIMRGPRQPKRLRIECAIAAAPYLHARLSAVQVQAQVTIGLDEKLKRARDRLAAAGLL
ncbi:MAG TPA: hypothetical protein VGM15_03315 [Burkholderiaceae bacterium]|jgi:hypothetical protein